MRIHRQTGVLAAGVLIAALAAAGRDTKAETVTFDPAQSKVEFTLGDVLHTVHGAFKLTRGSVQFDPENGKASGELVIDPKSGDSGSGARDSRMKSNILEADKYPEITFRPDYIKGPVPEGGSGHVDVHGVFRIHGADHELTLPVDVERSGQRLTMKTHFDVPYVQWGMKNPSTFLLKVDKTVRIDIQSFGKLE